MISATQNDAPKNLSTPFHEDSNVKFMCISYGGKPPPLVRWFVNNQLIETGVNDGDNDGSSGETDTSLEDGAALVVGPVHHSQLGNFTLQRRVFLHDTDQDRVESVLELLSFPRTLLWANLTCKSLPSQPQSSSTVDQNSPAPFNKSLNASMQLERNVHIDLYCECQLLSHPSCGGDGVNRLSIDNNDNQ